MDKQQDRLGDLELAIMKVLWESQEPLDVNQVSDRLGGDRAYTTVMTTLSRLHKKGYLNQERDGRSFRYSHRIAKKTFLKRTFSHIADFLFNGDVRQLVPHILGMDRELTDDERNMLREICEGIKDLDDE